MDALVIVHLSSLDAFTDHYGLKKGMELGNRIAEAIEDFDGTIYVIDQGWPLRKGHVSDPRREVIKAIHGTELRKDVRRITFDQSSQDWPKFVHEFSDMLLSEGVDRVLIGGVWFDPEYDMGCTSDVFLQLRDLMEARVDPAIAGCVP